MSPILGGMFVVDWLGMAQLRIVRIIRLIQCGKKQT